MPRQYKDIPKTVKLSEAIIEKFKNNRLVLLTTGTGSGKTYVTIRTAGLISNDTVLLIFAPKSKILDNSWQESIDSYNQAKNTNITQQSFTYAAINTEKGPKNIKEILTTAHAKGKKVLLVLDEAHEIKLSSAGKISSRAKKMITLAQAPEITHILGVTATPAPNSYLDYGTYFIMNGYYKNKTQFLTDQVKMFNDRHAPIVKDQSGTIHREYFNDPDKLDKYINDITVYMDTSEDNPDMQSYYQDFEIDDTIKYVDEYFSEEFNDSEPRTRLRHYKKLNWYKKNGYFESSSSFIAQQRRILTADPNRLKWLGYYMFENTHRNDTSPILLFYQFNQEKDAVIDFVENNEYLKHYEIRLVNGKIKQLDPFTNQNTIVLIQYKAGSSAIEFPDAYTTIFFMPTYYYDQYSQAQGRNVRSFGTHNITQFKFRALNTLDVHMWNILENKKSFTRYQQDQYFTVQNNPFN